MDPALEPVLPAYRGHSGDPDSSVDQGAESPHRSSWRALMALVCVLAVGAAAATYFLNEDQGNQTAAPVAGFTAQHSAAAVRVCSGETMSNAATYRAGSPGVVAAVEDPARPGQFTVLPEVGDGRDWGVPDDEPGQASAVLCLRAVPKSGEVVARCRGENQAGAATSYVYRSVEYRPQLVAARTGRKLAQAEALLSGSRQGECPQYALSYGGTSYASPQVRDVERLVAELVE